MRGTIFAEYSDIAKVSVTVMLVCITILAVRIPAMLVW